MPSEYFAAVEQSNGTLLLAIIFIGLCLLFVGLYFWVQSPKRGTLEWISFYEDKHFEPFTYDPINKKDILPFFLSFITALLICSGRIALHYRLDLMPDLGKNTVELLLSGGIMTLALSIAFYGFFRVFFNSRFVAYLITCLSCALFSKELFTENVLLLVSWFFLYLWVCCNYKDYKWYHSLYLFLSGVIYAITLTICWPTFYLFPIYLAGFIVGKTVQIHPGDSFQKKGRFFTSLLIVVITGCIGILAMWLVYYAYKNENMNLLKTALSGEAYHSFIPTFLERMANLTVPHTNGEPVVRQDIFRPILFITSLIPTIYCGIFRKKSRALAAVFCAIWFLCAWIFAGIDLMCPGSMLSIGFMLKGFRDRERRYLAASISLAVILFYFASLFIDFII